MEATSPSVTVKRIPFGNDVDDTNWIVLEGSIDGCPQATRRRSINSFALAQGTLTIEAELGALIQEVRDAVKRFQAVQDALGHLPAK